MQAKGGEADARARHVCSARRPSYAQSPTASQSRTAMVTVRHAPPSDPNEPSSGQIPWPFAALSRPSRRSDLPAIHRLTVTQTVRPAGLPEEPTLAEINAWYSAQGKQQDTKRALLRAQGLISEE
jgi:hypothetical protein